MTASAVRFCHLHDQKPISQEAYQRGRRLGDQIRALIAGREDFLRQTRRSAEAHLPQGPWAPGGERYDAYQAASDGDYAVLNNLRLYWQGLAGRPPASFAEPGPEVDDYLERIAHLPDVLHLSSPNVFGETGWLVNGKIVNRDAVAHLECVAHLAQSGKLWELAGRTPDFAALRKERWRRPRILEIGPGYGGLAHHVRSLVPHARYYLVDLPESLLFAAIYLFHPLGRRQRPYYAGQPPRLRQGRRRALRSCPISSSTTCARPGRNATWPSTPFLFRQ